MASKSQRGKKVTIMFESIFLSELIEFLFIYAGQARAD